MPSCQTQKITVTDSLHEIVQNLINERLDGVDFNFWSNIPCKKSEIPASTSESKSVHIVVLYGKSISNKTNWAHECKKLSLNHVVLLREELVDVFLSNAWLDKVKATLW